MPTVTATALRAAAEKYYDRSEARSFRAGRGSRQAAWWRECLAADMEAAGVTRLTVRSFDRQCGKRVRTVTVYAYTDGSPFAYRYGGGTYTPEQFARLFPSA
jgi:hypothetical protein